MNADHAQLCSSEEWAEHIRDEVLPRALGGRTLGGHVLEVGPGYGAATRWIVGMVDRLTVIELDRRLADDLEAAWPSVTVVRGDSSTTPFDDATFTAVVCFTMLHHVPSRDGQDATFAEAARVLGPDGILVGSDSLASPSLAEFHGGDTYNPVDPDTLEERLLGAGFAQARRDVWPELGLLTFVAGRQSG